MKYINQNSFYYFKNGIYLILCLERKFTSNLLKTLFKSIVENLVAFFLEGLTLYCLLFLRIKNKIH
jgi:hypothetical protein